MWKYLPLFNALLQIITTLIVGALFSRIGLINADRFVPPAVDFVCKVAIPCLFIRGFGIDADLVGQDKEMWVFVACFLVLCTIGLIASLLVVFVTGRSGSRPSGSFSRKNNVRPTTYSKNNVKGQNDDKQPEPLWRRFFFSCSDRVVVYWNCMTLTSTLIMGIPLCTGLLGDDEAKGIKYSTLAGIAVFLYQFPGQIILMEFSIAAKEEEGEVASSSTSQSPDDHHRSSSRSTSIVQIQTTTESVPDEKKTEISNHQWDKVAIVGDKNNIDADVQDVTRTDEDVEAVDANLATVVESNANNLSCSQRSSIRHRATKRILQNTVVQSELVALLLTLSRIGPRFLSPTSEEVIPGLEWIYKVISWFGACASPLSIFSMGVWMQRRGLRNLVCLGISEGNDSNNAVGRLLPVARFMILKLLVVPLVMVGIVRSMPSLDDESRHIAVLISSFPIAMLSFPVGFQYSTGETILSANFAAATVLLLPSLLLWEFALSSLGIFPLRQSVLIFP